MTCIRPCTHRETPWSETVFAWLLLLCMAFQIPSRFTVMCIFVKSSFVRDTHEIVLSKENLQNQRDVHAACMSIAFIYWCVCGHSSCYMLRVLLPCPLPFYWKNSLLQWEMCTPRKKDLVGASYVEQHMDQGRTMTSENPTMSRMDSTIGPLNELGKFRGKGYQSSIVWGLKSIHLHHGAWMCSIVSVTFF